MEPRCTGGKRKVREADEVALVDAVAVALESVERTPEEARGHSGMAPDDPRAGSPHCSSRDSDHSGSKQNAARNHQDGTSSDEPSRTPDVSRSSLDLPMTWRGYSWTRKPEAASQRTLNKARQESRREMGAKR